MKYRGFVLGALTSTLTFSAAWTAYAVMNRGDRPTSIVKVNGRLEVQRIEIATKFAGQVLTVAVDEGDQVKVGDEIAQMDPSDYIGQLEGVQAMKQRALQARARAEGERDVQSIKASVAQLELDSALELRKQVLISHAELQKRQAQRRQRDQGHRERCLRRVLGLQRAESSGHFVQSASVQAENRDEHDRDAPRGRGSQRLAEEGERHRRRAGRRGSGGRNARARPLRYRDPDRPGSRGTMKLATLKDGSRDGQLVVVSRDLSLAHHAAGVARSAYRLPRDYRVLPSRQHGSRWPCSRTGPGRSLCPWW